MANGGIIGPDNNPVIEDLITNATSSNPSFAVQPGTSVVKLLVVGGGGNANSGGQAGGGGAGGYRYFATQPVTGGNPYPLTVGGASSTSSAMGYTSSAGGNGAGGRGSNGIPGGSGGGAADHFPGGGGSGGSGNSGGYTPPEGNPGSGASPSANQGETPGAGGGSATPGALVDGTPDGNPAYWARGGQGTPNDITGTDLWYATGGCHPKGPTPSPTMQNAGYPVRANPSDWAGATPMANTGNGAVGEGPGPGATGVVIVAETGAGGLVASGVWKLSTQYEARKAGNW